MDYYPDNTLAHYFTKLPQPIDLSKDEAWDVGLVELQYPHTWFNVRKNRLWYNVKPNPAAKFVRHVLREGLYTTAEELVNQLNMSTMENKTTAQTVRFQYHKVAQKASLTLKGKAEILLSDALQRMLGFDSDLFTGTHPSKDFVQAFDAERVIDLRDGFYSLYVYCNLLAPRPVGDQMVPLLRIVPVKGRYGDEVTKTYENVHYHPIQHKYFDTIELDIRDDTGRPVPFERGKVVTTLHFKKRRSPLFA